MKKSAHAILVLVVAGTLVYAFLQFSGGPVAEPQTGPEIYARNCAGCHGTNGTGNGRAAQYLFPKPRDFTTGVYKFTSTPNGKLPTDRDLERIVKNGLSPGGMPGFGNVLSDQQIARVVDYVKTFSDRFKKETVPEPVSVSDPPEPLVKASRVQRGRQLYDKLGCQSCHGPKGKGNGPTADQQVDRWGEPIPPRDLTRGNFKGGEDPTSIYRRVVTGITGTGMPPYGSVLQNESDRWALVAFVKSLSRGRSRPESPKQPTGDLTVKTVKVGKKTLIEPGAPVWETAERIRMPLYSLWLTDRTPFDSVEVRALHNGEFLALRMSWDDPTRNMTSLKVTQAGDAGAVMFPNLTGAVPFLGMGKANMRGGLAHIWHWRAADQFAVNRGGYAQDLEDRAPDMQVNYYPRNKNYEPGSRIVFENYNQHTSQQPTTFQSGWAAGNPLSKPIVKSPVKSYRARGFGTLTALDRKKMRVDGNGVYEDGWAIVMIRPLKTETNVVQFEPGDRPRAAFAVWDGEQGDRNGKKDITGWITLKLSKK